jgi:hypothetical protein
LDAAAEGLAAALEAGGGEEGHDTDGDPYAGL